MRKMLWLMTLNTPNKNSKRLSARYFALMPQPRERVEIDIATGQNNSDPLSDDVDLILENHGIRNGSGRLDDDFHCFPDSAHRRDNRVFAHGHHIVNVTLDNRKVSFTDICSQSISNLKVSVGCVSFSCEN